MNTRSIGGVGLALFGILASFPSYAVTYTNVAGTSPDFPGGDISFADQLVSFSPGIVYDSDIGQNVPLNAFLRGQNTIGVPDLTTTQAYTCFFAQTQDNCKFASLGVGGSLVVRFTDNVLFGSDSTALDLWIFETGPDIEDTFVDVSADGVNWSSVGMVGGSTSGVDIDAFGFGSTDLFYYVRLTDDPNEGDGSPGASNIGSTVGADIDAIGAISTAPAVPVPAAGWLGLTAFLALGRWARRRR